jgi:hypothetical protein
VPQQGCCGRGDEVDAAREGRFLPAVDQAVHASTTWDILTEAGYTLRVKNEETISNRHF